MRRVVVVAVALLGLTGCAAPQADPGIGNADVATGGRLFSTADTETAKFTADVGPGVFPRTVTHAGGTTTIPAPPARVAVLDSGELDGVLALGVTPVAIAVPNRTVPSYLADRVRDVPIVGDTNTIELEGLAAAKPDLILGSKLRVDQLYDKLSAIAPTVLSIRPGFPWKEDFLLVGTALGKETEAVEVLNDYQRKVDEVKATLPNPAPTISLVRFMPGRIRLYGNLSMIGVVLGDLGLRRPPEQDFAELAVEVSEERIDAADGDWIFYSSYGPPENTAQEAVVNGELWQRLGAVQAGHVRAVDDEVWFLGLGPNGVMKVLDELPELLGS
ncbi:iron complex transport system substrate-binding protein [Pseudonocardia thermophila]|jgi:ABC-type Fe3+-hydroxamate transport system, periplasmic component|uniref:Iron complex transport system substrate-binding protein n=1 Tax=Pseudonocardia thermophila TaxID=1848 RepID=A0A1M6QE64_PSETH|nr:iron-siderophore ABC transporter substrate-binding protein [Pseudonocardia thermophila]SHK18353.1 iron complex transport system substrate-binding protein [Pseudonocardia thermophila]